MIKKYYFFILLPFLSGCGSFKQPIRSKRLITAQTKKLPYPPEMNKAISDTTFDEAQRVKKYCLQTNNHDLAIKYVAHMINSTNNQNELKILKFELAELYFELGKTLKAGKAYSEYIMLYPGSEHKEDAEYKRVLCKFYDTLDYDRDQTKTKEALALTQNYLKKENLYQKYIREVKDVQTQCCKKLYDHEMGIFKFYLKKESYAAAEQRLHYIRDHYLVLVEGIEPEILQLECTLAEKQGKTELLAQKQAEFERRYPHHSLMLAQHKSKIDYAKIF